MDEAIMEIVAELHAKCAAFELVLVDLMFDAWPLESHRNERRESVCRALEQQIEGVGPNSHLYLHMQRVLAAIEGLFDTPGPPSAAERP